MVQTVGDIRAKIGGDNARLKATIRDSQRTLRRFGESAARVAKRVALIGTAAGAAGAALGIAFVNRGLDAIDAQSKLARQIGTTVESIQVLDRAAELSGVRNMTRNVQAITRAMGEARQGVGTAKDALERLGLTLEQLEAVPADQRLILIAEAMDRLGFTATDRANVLREFQVRGTDLAIALENGGAAIRRAREEVERFGVSVSEVDAARIEEANDSLSALRLAITAVRNQLAVAAAPFLDVLADQLGEAAAGSINLRETFEGLLKTLARGVFELDELRQRWFGDEEERAVIRARARIEELRQTVTAITERGPTLMERLLGSGPMGRAADEARIRNIGQEIEELQGFLARSGEEGYASAEDRYQDFLARLEQSRQDFEKRQAEREANQARNLQRRAGAGSPSDERELERNRDRLQKILEDIRDANSTEIELAERQRDERLKLLEEVAAGDASIRRRQAQIAVHIEQEANDRINEIRAQQAEEVMARQQALRDFEISLLDGKDRDVAREQEQYQRRLEQIQEFLDQRVIVEAEAAELREAAEEQHQARITEIQKRHSSAREQFAAMTSLAQTRHVLGALNQQIGGIQTGNRKIFALQKALAISEAVVNTYAGVTRALKDYPAPISYAVAAATAAFGFARVAAIASQSLGGGRGGGAGSGGGGSGAISGSRSPADLAADTRPTDPQRGTLNVSVQGIDEDALLSGRQLSSIIDQINDQIADGAVIGSIRLGSSA